ncbi:MAG: polysaccharide deacetylase family protein [Chthoniobacter sp.]|nr:polysaccharide deacetylase family protein [Chthoniobacter sp.]
MKSKLHFFRRPAVRFALLIFVGSSLSGAEPVQTNTPNDPSMPADPYGILLKPIPEKLVVLTFDDSCVSHATFVAPLLKKYGFGRTFYISNAFAFKTRKDWYMTWEQIKTLDEMGLEVGNHTLGHGQLSATGVDGCTNGLVGIEELCRQYNVSKPITFCWPFYSVNNKFQRVLSEKGYLLARGGNGQAYIPTLDNPFDVPSFTTVANTPPAAFTRAAKMVTQGKVVVFTFHGVPDGEHPGITVEPARFESALLPSGNIFY